MRTLGLTAKEWYAFGIGGALSGALMGALIHSTYLFVFNSVCLALNIYYFTSAGEGNGPDHK